MRGSQMAWLALAGLMLLLATASAQSVRVREAVGIPLNQAVSLTKAGDFKAALEKLNQADSVPDKTKVEADAIAHIRLFIGVTAGDPAIGGAAAAKAKYANDWSAHKYEDVVADEEMLRKYDLLDDTAKQVIAEAYYKSGDMVGCVRYIERVFGKPTGGMRVLDARCAYGAGDEETLRAIGWVANSEGPTETTGQTDQLTIPRR